MRIERIDIQSFGALQQYSLEFPAARLAVIVGPNEAGKSTLAAFIRAMLYGLPRRHTGGDRYESLDGSPIGGRMSVIDGTGGRWQIERLQRTQGIYESIQYIQHDGQVRVKQQSDLEKELLGGLNSEMYGKLFAVTLDELHALHTLQGDELRAHLYDTGFDTVSSIADSERWLQQEMDKLFKPRGRTQAMYYTLQNVDELQRRRKVSNKHVQRLEAARGELDNANESTSDQLTQRVQLRQELALAERALHVSDAWIKLVAVRSELEELPEMSGWQPLWAERWQRLLQSSEGVEARIRQLEEKQRHVEHQLQVVQPNASLLAHAAEINRLCGMSETAHIWVQEASEVRTERELAEDELWRLARLTDRTWTPEMLLSSDMSQSVLESVRGQGKQLEQLTAQVERMTEARTRVGREYSVVLESKHHAATVMNQHQVRGVLDSGFSPQDTILHGIQRKRDMLQQAVQLVMSRQLESPSHVMEQARGTANGMASRSWSTLVMAIVAVAAAAALAVVGQWLGAAVVLLFAILSATLFWMNRPQAALREHSSVVDRFDADKIQQADHLAMQLEEQLAVVLSALSRSVPSKNRVSNSQYTNNNAESVREHTEANYRNDPDTGIPNSPIAHDAVLVGVGKSDISPIENDIYEPTPSRSRSATLKIAANNGLSSNDRDGTRHIHSAKGRGTSFKEEDVDELGGLLLKRLDELNAAIDAVEAWMREHDRLVLRQQATSDAEQSAKRLLAAAENDASQASGQLKACSVAWQQWLSARRLPAHWSPPSVLEHFRRVEQAAECQRQRERLRAREERVLAQVREYTDACARLAAAVGYTAATASEAVTAESLLDRSNEPLASVRAEPALPDANMPAWDEPTRPDAASLSLGELSEPITEEPLVSVLSSTHSILSALRDRIEQEERQSALQRQLKHTLSDAAEEQRQALAELSILLAKLNELYAEAGTQDEEAFAQARSHADRYIYCSELLRELEAACYRGGALEAFAPVEELLVQFDARELEERRNDLLYRMDTLDGEIRDSEQRVGRLQQEVERLKQEVEGEQWQQQLADLESELHEQASKYAVYALAKTLIRRTRQRYEEEKQPVVFKRAGDYFRAMTAGKYIRIVSPLGTQRIVVEHQDGRLIDSSRLSRGTAEQVYLAMRFALAEVLSERVALPFIWDDILVNFDEQRLLQTVGCMPDIMRRHQIIWTTCHSYMVELIEKVIPDVHVMKL
ncbi:AAA family ATPase [Paenibacillus sp. UMB4589-SE434]|uniref:AAA family ATPase n=1 Tax=Paenibacillus sp. UMB4589-SE434 TaxID=3046314 RepID=UPI002550E084|nr:AAA family ATPase [Paenibacillus sp. UMB4589-SE434]MDK8182533.1 AAA family ATPase [Paenibacillus sp. UMB4589-SE434]